MSSGGRSGALEQNNTQSMRSTRASSSNNAPAAPPVLPDLPRPDTPVPDRCEYILKVLEAIGLSLGELVNTVCYGDDKIHKNQAVIDARGSMYNPEQLLRFLETCYWPPLPPSKTGRRPVGARPTVRQFIFTKARETFAAELKAFSEDYSITQAELANADYVAALTSDTLYAKIKSKCPELSALILALTSARPLVEDRVEVGEDEDDEGEGPKLPPPRKHPNFDLVFQITSMAYRLNPRRNTLQKVLTVYMKAKHTAKPVFELLQQAGVTMSYWWIKQAISNLSADLRNQAILAAHTRPILLIHDNIRLKYGVRSQRGDNQSITDNGTASTLIVLPDSASAFEDPDDFGPFLRALKAKRRAGTALQLSWKDLDTPARHVFNRTSATHDMLDHFRLVPGLVGSKLWQSTQLKRPTGPQQLPHGPEHRLEQHMLRTTNIDESSYSGNSQVIPFVLGELKLDSEPARSRLMLERLLSWVGDQVTAQRCRQMQSFRQESINSIVRWEPFLFFFGGLHLLMALGQALLDRFRGSTSGPTFADDIIRLSRTGLEKTSGKTRLDFHTVDEFLLQNAEAHFVALFRLLSGCKTEEEVTAWAETHTASDLYRLASDAVTLHASSAGLDLDDSDDDVRQLVILRQRDLLLYYSIRRAYKHGDVDRIEALLPELLLYFIGSGNGNYAKEVFEFLQLITYECTPAVRTAILQHGLVVNKLGRADSFYPVDQCQEFNIAGIKNYGPPPQNASWEQYGRISNVIPFFMDIVEHVEHSITGISRSHIHKNPKRDKDIQALIKNHQRHGTHEAVAGRRLGSENKPKDCRKVGVLAVRDHNVLADYHAKRDIYYTASSSRQEFEDIPTHPGTPAPPVPLQPPAATSSDPLAPSISTPQASVDMHEQS